MNDKNEEKIGEEIFGQDLETSDQHDEDNNQDPIIEGRNGSANESLSGASVTIKEGKKYNEMGPNLSSDDIDANWQDGETTGQETSMGPNPTPDQDQVDAISEPWGTDYKSDEELNVAKKAKKLEDDREQDENNDLLNK